MIQEVAGSADGSPGTRSVEIVARPFGGVEFIDDDFVLEAAQRDMLAFRAWRALDSQKGRPNYDILPARDRPPNQGATNRPRSCQKSRTTYCVAPAPIRIIRYSLSGLLFSGGH
jgi:hypothetical protein